ncbi:MAG TPA: cytochrome-c peroxidase, partial [Polyangiales bacterium]|nr:cytochrome-c peroxidase [Polyangiales bacterium]
APPALRQIPAVDDAVPPISGGTMLTTADGSTVVAADPDRDQVYFVDAQGMRLLHTRALNEGDEPGRVVEDAAGRIHVVLRSTGAIATLGREADSAITRRAVCAVPRGIAYDAASDQLHVACAEGKLVTLGAAPSEVTPSRTLQLSSDLRDVLVRGDKLFVSRFRSAELLILNKDGTLEETRRPQSFAHDEERTDLPERTCSARPPLEEEMVHVESTPNVAWRMIDVPNKGVSVLHQRSRTDEIRITQGGYGVSGCDGGIVQTAVTLGLDSAQPMTADLAGAVLAVDFAVDPDATLMVLIAPGNFGGSPQLQVTQLAWFDPTIASANGAPDDPTGPKVGRDIAHCSSAESLSEPRGQAIALTLTSAYELAVLEREPAAISFYDLRTRTERARVDLGQPTRFDTGHAIFHGGTNAGLACASCHPEAGDDAHVWTFESIGPRRTQTLRGGLLGTEPLHWNGDMADFRTLVNEVFVGRMSGFTPTPQQADALAGWLDAQPALHADPADSAAAERGKLLFESAETRCTQCHVGAQLTNNLTEDVGTGAALQVPSLRGVRFRAPLMHDGCAANLSERFTNVACGGGDNHGTTSQLSATQVSDLTAYLDTL